MRRLVFSCVAIFLGSGLLAQERKTSGPKVSPLPANLDCERLKGDIELPSNRPTRILKRGADYYACRPKSDAALTTARTAAVVVRSTQTISCGDGSSDDCIREDRSTEQQVAVFADETDLWRYFDKVAPSKADLILQFVANNRAGPSSEVILQVQDSGSGAWAYYESRTITDIGNDVNRLVEHFLLKCGRAPLRSNEELQRDRHCAAITARLSELKSQYEKKRTDYDFKTSHPIDALIEECKIHWQEWVCLKRGEGGNANASAWYESGQELQRKLSLEYDELKKLEQQLIALTQDSCS